MSLSRIDDLRILDPVLSALSQGYSNGNFVADKLFPIVEVSKLKGKVPFFGKEAFTIRELKRSTRGSSNRVAPIDFNLMEFQTQERDIEIAIDYIEQEETYDYPKYERQVVKNLRDSLLLNREKEAADIAQNLSNYSSDLKRSLTLAEAFDDYTTISDPVKIIKDSMEILRKKIGKNPNTIIMGKDTFNALKFHPKVLDKIKYNGIAKATTDVIKELFEVKAVAVGQGVYTNDGTTFMDIWADNLIIAYVDQNEGKNKSEYNPSYGYTFVREGMPEVDTYYENGGKVKVIRCTDNFGVKLTSDIAGFIISNTIQTV